MTSPLAGSFPLVSLIVPMRNEAEHIGQCLDSLINQDYPADQLEFLVIDGNSIDKSASIVQSYTANHSNIRLLSNPRKITPTALNIGVQAAHGNLIVPVSAHSVLPSDYVRQCVRCIERTGADNVGGLLITMPRGMSSEARLVQALTTHRFGVGNADYRLNASERPADTVPYGCYRQEVFERIGWFDERLVRNQDYEFNRRLLHAGGLIWRNPAIWVFYHNQGTLLGLLHQALFTGKYNPWMWYLAPYSFASRHAIPGFFVLGLMVILGLTAITVYAWAALAFIIISYYSLAIVASWQQARRHGFWMLPLLPFLFFAYHVAYGIGILWGTLLLIIRRSPVQNKSEPWPGAGRFRAWPKDADPQKQ